jgi:hypothetical protein
MYVILAIEIIHNLCININILNSLGFMQHARLRLDVHLFEIDPYQCYQGENIVHYINACKTLFQDNSVLKSLEES